MNCALLTLLTKFIKRNLKNRNGEHKGFAVDLSFKVFGDENINEPGSKPPVFLLHGLLASKRNWESVAKNITAKTKRRVVCVDLRNHGQSPHTDSHEYKDLASDVLQLLKKLNVEKATLLGHSMGGRTAMVAALTQPYKVNSLIVVDISPAVKSIPHTGYLTEVLDAMSSVDFEGIKDMSEAKNLVRKSLKSAVNESTLHAILMNVTQDSRDGFTWICNVKCLRKHISSVASFPKEMEGKVYEGPTLFVAGEKSDYIRSQDISIILKYFPISMIQYVPNAGHNVHADNASKFLELIVAFLK